VIVWCDEEDRRLTMSGVLGFAPASNKHLIASVKPIRAASAKGLPVPFTLAPACQFMYRRQNSEMFPYIN